jgi:hypothetical protein
MEEIEEYLKNLMGSINRKIPGGTPMKRLLVLVIALVGGLMAYRWLKENLAKLLEV